MSNIFDLLENKKVYIISPHFDDALLSCSTLLGDKRVKEIHVVNVFTKANDGPYSLAATKYLVSCTNGTNATDLYSERLKEDVEALNSYKVASITNLDFTDALFRKNTHKSVWPEKNHFYPTFYGNVIGNIHSEDPTQAKLVLKLQKLIPKDAVVVCPLGIGSHVDHLITRKACEELNNTIIYYSDFPYNIENSVTDKITLDLDTFECEISIEEKLQRGTLYKTQFRNLFPTEVFPHHQEQFFVKKATALRVVTTDLLSEEIKKQWLELWESSQFANPFNSPHWFSAYLEIFPPKKYSIICVYKENTLVALAYFIKSRKYGISIFNVPPEDFICGLPFLVDLTDKSVVKLLTESICNLGNVCISNVTETLINLLANTNIVNSHYNNSINYYIADLQNDKSHISKCLTKALGKPNNRDLEFEVEFLDGTNTLGINTAINIDLNSRKESKGFNPFSNAKTIDFYNALSKNFGGMLKVNLLKLSDNYIAYEIGFCINNTYYGSQIGYIGKYAKHYPGKILALKLVQWLGDNGTNRVDFGSGENDLKKAMTKDTTNLYYLVISSNSLVRSYIINTIKVKAFLFKALYKNQRIYAYYSKIKRLFMRRSNVRV